MQRGMTVSKAGTEALAATVTVVTCTRTDRDWLEDVREKGYGFCMLNSSKLGS